MNPSPTYIGPCDVARATGVSPRKVRRVLATMFPEHNNGVWWRFKAHEMPVLVQAVLDSRKRFRSIKRVEPKQ